MIARIVATLTLWLFSASMCAADTESIQNHEIQLLFIEEPCGAVIAQIDDPVQSPEPPVSILEELGFMAMAFGFLMGFEVENPGSRGEYETILARLRAACSARPDSTALQLLRDFADAG